MTEQHAADELYFRTQAVLDEYVKIVRPYLPSLNGTSSESNQQLIAFNLLERLCYNARGAHLLYDEYGVNQNMGVPLSQIFRAIVYDVVISYWLLKQGQFKERLILLNADYIQKNGTRISAAVGPERLQEVSYKSWAAIAPENFTIEAGVYKKVNAKTPPFSVIAQGLKAEEPSGFFKELDWLYAVLSQQAHVSSFSKMLIYDGAAAKAKSFHKCCRGLLVGSSMLVGVTQMGEYEAVKAQLDRLLLQEYPWPAAEQDGD